MRESIVTTAKLVDDFRTLTHDAEMLLRSTAGDAGDQAREVRRKINQIVEAAKGSMETVQEKMVAGAKATDRTIRDHPYETLGIGFGVGMVIGMLLSRRR